MMNLEVRTMNNFADKLSDVEFDISKAIALVGELLEDYNVTDTLRMRDKLMFEAPRVMIFLEMVFDYVVKTHKEILKIQDDLTSHIDGLKEKERAS